MTDFIKPVSVPTRIIGSDDYWQLMLTHEDWTPKDIALHCGVHTSTVREFARRLVAGGYAVIKGKKVHSLIKRPLQKPRLREDGTEQEETAIETLWRSMRMAKTFTVTNLIEFTNGRSEPIAESTARLYIRDLSAVGIVAPVEPKAKTYCLVRNLGSRAPRVLSTRIVFDPNARAVVGIATANEVHS